MERHVRAAFFSSSTGRGVLSKESGNGETVGALAADQQQEDIQILSRV